jgi:tetratricopeptide (TPR) repeat protein
MPPLLDARGLAVTALEPGSLERFEAALASLHGGPGDALASIDEALAADPAFVAGHCLRAAALLLAGACSRDPRLAQSTAALQSFGQRGDERERRHAAAALTWAEGDPRLALQRYGELVVDYPRDSLALQLAHALDFRLGQREMLRDRVAQVLPHWDERVPGFAHVLGMYAFGLEENGDYPRAEATALRSLALEPHNAAAIHVVAHVTEMQGRPDEGIGWLHATRDIWLANRGFAVHTAWHLALFHLDLDAGDAALAIYDELIAPEPSGSTAALVDASALLWRLDLRGMSLAGRWRELAAEWKRKSLRGERAFNLVHALIAFTGAGDARPAREVAALLRHDPITREANTADDLALSVPLSVALQAFGRGDYAQAVEAIDSVRAAAHRCGGSVAQCDLIHLTLTEAALRARHTRLARALAAERAARKPDSALNRWLFARSGLPLGSL